MFSLKLSDVKSILVFGSVQNKQDWFLKLELEFSILSFLVLIMRKETDYRQNTVMHYFSWNVRKGEKG